MNEVKTRSIPGIFVALAAAVLLFPSSSPAQAGGQCLDPVTSASSTTVHLEGVCFSPTVVHVKAGTTVTWTNDLSKAPHTVTGVNGLFASPDQLTPGSSFSHQFTDKGIFPYYCTLHPSMAGTVVVEAAGTGTESVSLVGGSRTAALTSSGGAIDNVWLFVLLSAAAAVTAAAGGFLLGMRRTRK